LVLATVTVAEPGVVLACTPAMLPPVALSAAPTVYGAELTVISAGRESTKCVLSVMLLIVAPEGMPAPLTLCPGISPVVLPTVTVELDTVVAPFSVSPTGCRPKYSLAVPVAVAFCESVTTVTPVPCEMPVIVAP
jgi:hypothetical protein